MTARGSASAGLAELYRLNACKSVRCAKTAIEWVPTARQHPVTRNRVGTGEPVPLDRGRDPYGSIVLDRDPGNGEWMARPFVPDDDPGRPRYTVHWSTCHTPELYRRVRAAADPHGLFPPLSTRRSGSSGEGPCSVCGTPHPNRFGTGGSPLCPDCLRPVVAAWGPDMRSTVALWTPEFRRFLHVDGFGDEA